jgi:hypothetical protein
MNQPAKDLKSLGLDKAIRLRWALRDINSNRTDWLPVSPKDLHILASMRLIETIDGKPVITVAGMDEMNIAD